jgi:predicted glycoside hydrolase/deacetylase ChbG (UPF0249 family)
MNSTPPAGYARVAGPARTRRSPSTPGPAGRFPVIVHADDFGESREITVGIRRGIESGAVTSTSIMANMPGTDFALGCVSSLADRASFGVHLNLCEGAPLTTGRSLSDAHGQFHPKRELFLRAITGRLSLAEVEAEVTAQIARVRDAGVAISHLDGHKHLHQLPVVMTAVANVLPTFAIERVRITRLGSVARAPNAAALVRECLALKASRKFGRARLRSPVRIVDLQEVMRSPAQPRASGALVDLAGPVEWCCHPGTALADEEKPGSHRRANELEFLLSGRFRELANLNRVRFVSYWDV